MPTESTDRVPAGAGRIRRSARIKTEEVLKLMVLVTYAVFGVATLGFTQSLNTFDEDAPDTEGAATEATGSWVIEKNGEDAYPEMRDKRRASGDSHRYVNPHPELGCLYYDENDRAHWFPGCREL